MSVRDTDQAKEFREIDNGALLEEGNGELDVMIPAAGDLQYSYHLIPAEDNIKVSEDDMRGSISHEGEEVSAEEVNQLLEDDEITREKPLIYSGSQPAFYGPNLADPTSREPTLYDPEQDEFTEDGEEIPELKEFIEEYREGDTAETVSAFLKHLHDDLGMRHSTDVTEERAPGQENEPEENAVRALEQGHGLCGELERLFTYAMRNTGHSAGRPSNNILRYSQENGKTVEDPEGEYLVAHGFPMVEIGDEEVIVDPSVYMHRRDSGDNHEEAAAASVDRDEVYYTRNRIKPPGMLGFDAEIEEVNYQPLND